MIIRIAVLLTLCFSFGCLDEGTYQCETSAECTNSGLQGTCEGNGFCSFPDEECESGRRFGGSATSDVAGECVTDAAIACGSDVQIEAGDRHTCALISGLVRCWGSNVEGQLGNGTLVASSSPAEVLGLSNVTKISSGLNHTCALTLGGVVSCWGDNTYGELGLPQGNQPVALPAVAMTDAVDISAGNDHSCAIKSDGTAWCWGRNEQGQLGDDSRDGSYRPVRAVGLEGATAISAGFNHTCALDSANSVWCWGDDDRSQIGDVEQGDKLAPVAIGLADVATLDAGGDHTCAVTSENDVLCWGYNTSGQIGNGNNAEQPAPQLLYGVKANQISARANHTCVYDDAASELRCWGRNDYGQLGNGDRENTTLWAQVTGVSGVSAVSAGNLHTCAYVEGTGISCWGRNDYGQLGVGDTLRSAAVVAVPGVTNELSVAVGSSHSCALDSAGTVRCWGRALDGALGVAPNPEEIAPEMLGPITVSDLTGVSAVYSGENRTCAKSGTSMLCWGSDGDGLLGNGTAESQPVPTVITDLVADPQGISLGDNHTCAVDSAGAVYCWGSNNRNALGIDGGSTTTATLATATELVVVDEVSVGDSHGCARAAGAVTCWGNNDSGQLGDNTTTSPAAGTAVSAVLPAAALSLTSGSAHNCALVDGGGVFCWGANSSGQLGLGLDENAVSGPTQVMLPIAATAVVASDSTTCALLSDSRVFCWGSNRFQQLGLELETSESTTPVEITGVLASNISVSSSHVCVTTTDGAAQCWGDNFYTQLGGDRVPLSITAVQSEIICSAAPSEEETTTEEE